MGFLSEHESLVWLTTIAVEFDLSRHSSKLQVIEMNCFALRPIEVCIAKTRVVNVIACCSTHRKKFIFKILALK